VYTATRWSASCSTLVHSNLDTGFLNRTE
jgi:hypothetical protein